jgi:plasmid stabilization system protein ParE
MTVLFAPEAEEDLVALVGYLAEWNPPAAADLGRRIFSVIDKFAERRFDGPETVLGTGDRRDDVELGMNGRRPSCHHRGSLGRGPPARRTSPTGTAPGLRHPRTHRRPSNTTRDPVEEAST